MRCMALRFASIFLLAAWFVIPAASQEAKPPALIYHPWTKLCSTEICFIGADVGSECGVEMGAALIEKKGETKRTLRINLGTRTRASTERGVRILIDQNEPVIRPIFSCGSQGCLADYEAGAELVEQLKQGQTLVVDGVDAAGSPVSRTLPLDDFASAYGGPARDPKVMQLMATREEFQAQKRAEEARKVRCGSSQ